MKKIFLAICVALAATILVGCASTKKTIEKQNWWESEFVADKVANELMEEPAITGIGKSSLSGVTAQKAAKADARVSLAQRIGTTVSNEIASSLENEDDKETYKEEATLVANQVLSGSMQLAQMVDEDSGITYVLMGLPLAGLDKKLQSASMKTNNKEVREFMNTLTIEQLKTMFNVK